MSENGKQEIDRLEHIISTKEELVECDGRTIKVIKWNLKQTLKLSVALGQLVARVVKQLPIPEQKKGEKPDGTQIIAQLMSADLAEIADSQYDSILLIISETVVRGNFETSDEARAWTEDAGAEALEVLTVIARQNIRPLVKAIGNAVADVKRIVAARKGSR